MEDDLKQHDIEEWVLATRGVFHINDVCKELRIRNEDRPKVRTALSRLVDKGILERVGGKMGNYRLVLKEWEDIDIFGDFQFYNLRWPFPIHKLARVGRGGLIVVAGEKGLGKTGLFLNVANLNANEYDVWYFDSESGPDLLKERIFAMCPGIQPPLPFHLQRLEGYPEDLVKAHPDAVTIIDYIEEPDEAYRMAGILKRISDNLGSGVAIVALQKPPGRDYAYGGVQTKNKPQLYLSLSKNDNGYKQLKIVNSKSRVNPLIDPENKTWTYKLVNMGTKFTDIDPPDWEDIPF